MSAEAERDAEHERLTAPLGDLNIAHRVTLRVLAERPDDPQVQEQWSGRLQGMAMRGLVWRFPDKPWQVTAYARSLLDGPPESEPVFPRDEFPVDAYVDVVEDGPLRVVSHRIKGVLKGRYKDGGPALVSIAAADLPVPDETRQQP